MEDVPQCSEKVPLGTYVTQLEYPKDGSQEYSDRKTFLRNISVLSSIAEGNVKGGILARLFSRSNISSDTKNILSDSENVLSAYIPLNDGVIFSRTMRCYRRLRSEYVSSLPNFNCCCVDCFCYTEPDTI